MRRLRLGVTLANDIGRDLDVATGSKALVFELWEVQLLAGCLRQAMATASPHEYASINRLRDVLETF